MTSIVYPAIVAAVGSVALLLAPLLAVSGRKPDGALGVALFCAFSLLTVGRALLRSVVDSFDAQVRLLSRAFGQPATLAPDDARVAG